ncbi:MAG: PAS domain S-box protein, partial [Gammaproteobacteria bacterium]|nr:PAS domain S-box protein [Gammaproteobacteria bacterium]
MRMIRNDSIRTIGDHDRARTRDEVMPVERFAPCELPLGIEEHGRRLEYLAHLIDHVTDAVYVFNSERKIIYANNAAAVQSGYSRAELMTMCIAAIDPGFPAERRRELWEEARAGKRHFFETEHTRKDGSTFTVEISHGITCFDGVAYTSTLVRDISGRKLAQRRREELLFAMENSIDAIYLYHRDGSFRYVSESACRML